MHYVKKIYDPVHGFIYFSALEKELIYSPVFQRLHYIHQLGVAYLVYPGASHTRFEHSLGVMHLATQIFEQVMRKYKKPLEAEPSQYWRQVVRFAALCHDLGHLPFSHTAERVLLGQEGHEKWTLAFIESDYLQPIWEEFQKEYPDRNVVEEIAKVALGEEKFGQLDPEGKKSSFTPWQRVMSLIISGDVFGADRIDYLLRDARCTGVSCGLFDYHQLIETICILPGEENEMTLGVEEGGIESCEALLLARRFMHRRVYQYSSVQVNSFHMARFIQGLYQREKVLSSLDRYLEYTDNEVLSELRKAFVDPQREGHADAKALLASEDKYLAIELLETFKKEKIDRWKSEFKIEEEKIEVALVKEKAGKTLASFPVLSHGQKVIDAKSCFSISVPSVQTTWMYVDPKYKDSINELTLAKYPEEKEG